MCFERSMPMLPYQYQATYPYYSQMYQNSYQNQPNAYLQQVQNQASSNGYNQQPFQHGIMGRVVNDFSEIVANDVPMDGRSAVFPKNDMTEIQVRAWGADGKIQTTSYKPILAQNTTDTINSSTNSQNVKIELSDDVKKAFMDRFDDITNRLDVIEQAWNKTVKQSPKTKKDGDIV